MSVFRKGTVNFNLDFAVAWKAVLLRFFMPREMTAALVLSVCRSAICHKTLATLKKGWEGTAYKKVLKLLICKLRGL